MAAKSKIILPDAQVIIDLNRMSIWKKFTQVFDVEITPIILQESSFYKDKYGRKQPINLKQYIEEKSIQVIKTTIAQTVHLHSFLQPNIQSPLDDGELEAIAFLKSMKQDNYLFCSGDALAVKYVGALGLSHRSISLEKLCDQNNFKANLEPKYSDAIFQKMLKEGFRDANILLKKSNFS